jgi:Flp pilus assembly protein TadD
MFNVIEQHHLIKDYRRSSLAWDEQTQSQWQLASEEFANLRQQAESREYAAAQAFCAGQAARKIELFEQAIQYFQEALELIPDWPLALEALAAAYRRFGKRSEVENCLSKALKLDSGLTHARMLFADLLCERYNYQAAEDVLQLALKANPNDLGIHLLLGHIALSDRRLKDAEKRYQNTLTLSPNSADAYAGLSSVRMLEERYNDALDYINIALKSNKNCINALLNKGIVLYTFNQPQEAEEVFNSVVMLAPRASQIYFRLAVFYWKQGNPMKAERYLMLAINSESYRAHFHSAFGLFLLQQNRVGEADVHFRQALLLNPNDIIGLHGVGMLAILNDEKQIAADMINRAGAILSTSKRYLMQRLASRLHPKLKADPTR